MVECIGHEEFCRNHLHIFKTGAICYVSVSDEETKLFRIKEQAQVHSTVQSQDVNSGFSWLYGLVWKLYPCQAGLPRNPYEFT